MRSISDKTIYWLSCGLAVLGSLLLLYLMIVTYREINVENVMANASVSALTKMTLYGVIFGVLIEVRKLIYLFRKGITVNWLIIPVVMLLVLMFIPGINWITWFGADLPFFLNIFSMPETHLLLAALSGILLVRSFVKMEQP